jgi:catechol 2,3-dioxygenase-like lactoylglutathione lyase family enzyme
MTADPRPTGVHLILFSSDPAADQTFFDDVLGLRSVQEGGGPVIFALPPAEIHAARTGAPFAHPHAGDDLQGAVIYLMCDDLPRLVDHLRSRQVPCAEITEQEFGSRTVVTLPSGGQIGLYQPSHRTPFD